MRPRLGSPCVTQYAGTSSGPCFANGLACLGASPLFATGRCEVPVAGYPCETSVGCAAGCSCISYGGSYCEQNCQTTADCSQPLEICFQAQCGFNQCGPGAPGGNQGGFYAPCDFGSCAQACPVRDQASDCPALQNCPVTGASYPDVGEAYACEP